MYEDFMLHLQEGSAKAAPYAITVKRGRTKSGNSRGTFQVLQFPGVEG